MKQSVNPAVARVLKRLHYPLDVILMYVRWYVAYPLSLRHLEEMMAERGMSVDHSIGTPMGNQAVECAGESVPALQTPSWQELADGRDLRQVTTDVRSTPGRPSGAATCAARTRAAPAPQGSSSGRLTKLRAPANADAALVGTMPIPNPASTIRHCASKLLTVTLIRSDACAASARSLRSYQAIRPLAARPAEISRHRKRTAYPRRRVRDRERKYDH
jgi:hypothetical protein